VSKELEAARSWSSYLLVDLLQVLQANLQKVNEKVAASSCN
jgi:hypothetical protein